MNFLLVNYLIDLNQGWDKKIHQKIILTEKKMIIRKKLLKKITSEKCLSDKI